MTDSCKNAAVDMEKYFQVDDARGNLPDTLTVRLPYGMLDEIRNAAEENDVSLSQEVRRRLFAFGRLEEPVKIKYDLDMLLSNSTKKQTHCEVPVSKPKSNIEASKRFVTVKAASEIAGRSAQTIRAWANLYGIGRRVPARGPWHIDPDALDRLLAGSPISRG